MKFSSSKLLLAPLLAAFSSSLFADTQPLPKDLPKGLKATIFAAPPMVNYPTFVCAAPDGALFVSVDKNGSLDKKTGRGFLYKLVDKDGDGVADTKTVFAENVTSPRGIAMVGSDSLVCLHPPEVTLFRDKDGDGIAEERKDIITGIGFPLDKRPPDHTSNGATLGIDGWLYLAIGDFGFMEATGADGRKMQLHAGGVVRIRPDGTGMELFARGTRNIYEVAVDPWLNMFARDNTNDGGGWDTRLEQYLNGVDLGYPRRFKNFTDETFPVLGIYGGGSGVGGVYVQEKNFGWPKGYDDALYTCDWGRSAVFRHSLEDSGAAFKTVQDSFCQLERVTDMKVDALGRAYLSSWKGATFSYKDENVGYIVQVKAENAPAKLPDVNFAKKADEDLVKDITNPDSHMRRLYASQELVQRGKFDAVKAPLEAAIADKKLTVPGRIAALFAHKQMGGEKANAFILTQLADDSIREFALRALGDRAEQGSNVPTAALVKHLTDKNDHVRAQAVIALDRLKRKEAAKELLAIAAEDTELALVTPADSEPRWQSGKLRKDKELEDCLVDIKGAKKLYLVANDFGDGTGSDHVVWLDPMLTGSKGSKSLTEMKWSSTQQGWGKTLVNKNCVGTPIKVKGKVYEKGLGSHAISVISYDIPADASYEHFEAVVGMEDTGMSQGNGGTAQFEVYVDSLPSKYGETKATGDNPSYTDNSRTLPHVASQALIRLAPADVLFAAVDNDPSRLAASLRVLRQLHDPAVVSGLLSRMATATEPTKLQGLVTAVIRLYFEESPWDAGSWGTRPDTSGPYYKRQAWSETPKIEAAIKAVFATAAEPIKKHISKELARHQVRLKEMMDAQALADPQWAKDAEALMNAMTKMSAMKEGDVGLLEPAVAIERTLKALDSGKANAKKGKALFISQGCIACHVTGKNDAPKGPNLFDIAQRYSPTEIMTSILNPSATVSQGFPTQTITLKNGDVVSGFAIKEGGEEVLLRNMGALTTVVSVAQIKDVVRDDHVSSMTPGLLNNLTPEACADLLAYFKSLAPK